MPPRKAKTSKLTTKQTEAGGPMPAQGQAGRQLALGVDSAGGYAVPKQLGGAKKPRKKVTRKGK